jgi:hypothetical protein
MSEEKRAEKVSIQKAVYTYDSERIHSMRREVSAMKY